MQVFDFDEPQLRRRHSSTTLEEHLISNLHHDTPALHKDTESQGHESQEEEEEEEEEEELIIQDPKTPNISPKTAHTTKMIAQLRLLHNTSPAVSESEDFQTIILKREEEETEGTESKKKEEIQQVLELDKSGYIAEDVVTPQLQFTHRDTEQQESQTVAQKVGTKDFKIIRVIGKGAYGKVFLVQKITGTDGGTL